MSFDDAERRQAQWEARSHAAQGAAAQAYGRLLHLAETGGSGQIRLVAQFLASTYKGRAFPFDFYDLRAVDVAISDDMLVCLDALRWGKADLHTLVPDGGLRVEAVCESWDLRRTVA